MAFGWLKNAFTQAAQEPWEKDRDDFFKAIKKNNVEQVKEIAARYPNEALGWKTENGSPLYVAHENNRLDAFKALVALGADINENYTFGKGRGRTPLLRAIDRKQPEWLEYIASNGGDLNKVHHDCAVASVIVIRYAYTPLSLAIEKGDEKAVKLLLSKGVDPAAPCYGGTIEKTVELTSLPAAYAESQKQFKMADMIKRAVLQKPPVPDAAEATQTASAVGVMQPLKLKKGATP
ncbi:MAG: ankyrin repeat domain-containing protein [Alphaproteobacteria bacterium]